MSVHVCTCTCMYVCVCVCVCAFTRANLCQITQQQTLYLIFYLSFCILCRNHSLTCNLLNFRFFQGLDSLRVLSLLELRVFGFQSLLECKVFDFTVSGNLISALSRFEWHTQHALPTGKEAQYQFNRKQGGFQSWSGCFTKKKHFYLCWEFNHYPLVVSIPKKENITLKTVQ